jgi:uncharacterized FAD-dependent dehydrogenase
MPEIAENANAAIVVQVSPADICPARSRRPLSEGTERAAFLAGGESAFAPASTVGAFLRRETPRGFGGVAPSYRPGVVACDLWACCRRLWRRELRRG